MLKLTGRAGYHAERSACCDAVTTVIVMGTIISSEENDGGKTQRAVEFSTTRRAIHQDHDSFWKSQAGLNRDDVVLDAEVDQLRGVVQAERFHHLILVELNGSRGDR